MSTDLREKAWEEKRKRKMDETKKLMEKGKIQLRENLKQDDSDRVEIGSNERYQGTCDKRVSLRKSFSTAFLTFHKIQLDSANF